MRLLTIMLGALALAACAPVAPEPTPIDTGPGSHGHICGGIAGFQCKAAGDYCLMPEGKCHMPDAAGTCTTQPQVCTREYAPVCGCDGKTYGNACEANAAGTSILYRGQCHSTAP